MENPIDNLDPRIAMALSAEFDAPSDPQRDRTHTVARLHMATLTEGQFYQRGTGDLDNLVKYHPDWAPVEVIASSESFLIQIACTVRGIGIGAIVSSKNPIGEIIRLEGDGNKLDLVYETPGQIARSSRLVAEAYGSYFSKFEGWTQEGNVWVPPTS